MFPASSSKSFRLHKGTRGENETGSRKRCDGGPNSRDRGKNRSSSPLRDASSPNLRRRTPGRDAPSNAGSTRGHASDCSKHSEEMDEALGALRRAGGGTGPAGLKGCGLLFVRYDVVGIHVGSRGMIGMCGKSLTRVWVLGPSSCSALSVPGPAMPSSRCLRKKNPPPKFVSLPFMDHAHDTLPWLPQSRLSYCGVFQGIYPSTPVQ